MKKEKNSKAMAAKIVVLMGVLAGGVIACTMAIRKGRKKKKSKVCPTGTPCSDVNESFPIHNEEPQDTSTPTAETKCNSPEWERGPE